MRRALLVALFALASGCGSGQAPDYAPNFAGLWNGTLTETDASTGAELYTGQSTAELEETSRSILKFANACEANGPFLQATSNTEFSILSTYACGPVSNGQCASIILTWNSIDGVLSGTTLAFTASATAAGCGETQTLGVSFSGAR
jgi:hypothetical protein